MFRAARIYIQRNPETGRTEWFFTAREGKFGPFGSKEIAKNELEAFIKKSIENCDNGGRVDSSLTIKPQHDA